MDSKIETLLNKFAPELKDGYNSFKTGINPLDLKRRMK